MSTPPSPSVPEERPGGSTGSEGSPSRKRSHAEMESGQHGAQRCLVVEIPSTHSTADDAAQSSPRVTPVPSPPRGQPENERPEPEAGAEDGLDPDEPLPPFDWQNLEARYHDTIKERSEEEQRLFAEFSQLMKFFDIWASTMTNHEVARTFARLRTRMAHVQHSEEELEKKRIHYTNVVSAFERALQLLG